MSLRTLTGADATAVYALLSEERVIRHMLFPKFNLDQASRFAHRFNSTVPTGTPPQVVFAIASTADELVLGLCGLVLDGASQQGELWYLLAPQYWGKGFATKAVHRLIDYGFDELQLHRIWASCLPVNEPSSNVLRRLGFRLEGHHRLNLFIQGQWRDSSTFALLATEWKAESQAKSR